METALNGHPTRGRPEQERPERIAKRAGLADSEVLRYSSRAGLVLGIANSGFLLIAFTSGVNASENVPHRPFALWADVAEQGQFVVGAVYEQAEATSAWAGGQRHDISYDSSGNQVNQGFFSLQYGLTERWTADLSVGATYASSRFFSDGVSESTTGFMDVGVGVRYQLLNEASAGSAWAPTATFRAGGVLPGSYNENFPFAPGLRSAAIEPEMLLRKHFGWPGLGGYGDFLYRWNHTTGNDQYIIALGFLQQLNCWELDLGWRHLQTLSGSDIIFYANNTVLYPRDPRENSDAIEAGVSYTTHERHFRYGVQVRAVFDGNNADEKFWFGLSADFPFGGKSSAQGIPQ